MPPWGRESSLCQVAFDSRSRRAEIIYRAAEMLMERKEDFPAT